ncbi:hypothetical protein [Actinomadura rugatobispora]|uniref:Uncharacterized protein n=1 Tax=Actinomadura rugatobispora TaxID=1994 RepID=A0ABW1AD23_9ACTN|nr:hypothetical protein GCM10010200_004160 [Actinomadura rugatobispora]
MTGPGGRSGRRLARLLVSRGLRAVRERRRGRGEHPPMWELCDGGAAPDRVHLVCRPATWRTLNALLDDGPGQPAGPLAGGLVEISLTRCQVAALVQRIAGMRWDLWKPRAPQQEAAIRFYRAVDRALEELARARRPLAQPLRVVVDEPLPPA